MEDLVKGEIGKVGAYDLDFKDGKLVLSLEISAEQIIDMIKEKIPGKVDDLVLELLKGVLKKL